MRLGTICLKIVALALLFFLFGTMVAERSGVMSMDKVHISTPEPIVFLKLAARAMADFFRTHGRYPDAWPELDIAFVNGPYRMTDPDIHPPHNALHAWRPKYSDYVYRLSTRPDGSDFRIDAIDAGSRIVYSITSGQSVPTAAPVAR